MKNVDVVTLPILEITKWKSQDVNPGLFKFQKLQISIKILFIWGIIDSGKLDRFQRNQVQMESNSTASHETNKQNTVFIG